MREPIVVFDRVWKKFRKGERHDSLRDLIPSLVKRTLSRPKADDLSDREFWSLRDISFDVRPGEALGIIGPNGAGKSTTLKLLTKILRPTRGSSDVKGRVGALIEVAAGFHPDLTGRENIFLQGAIMGIKQKEIAVKLEEIIEFAGISSFIDTPVKRYSSGMNARLGFSVAAHFEPDVLIIDEVLAVGDFAFQEKAFNRLLDSTRHNTAVVVVSHQLEHISKLCSKAMLLDKGACVAAGAVDDVIATYVLGRTASTDAERSADGAVLSRIDCAREPVVSGASTTVAIYGHTGTDPESRPTVSIKVRSLQTGRVIFGTAAYRCGVEIPRGPFGLTLALQMNVPAGMYALESVIWDRQRAVTLCAGPQQTIRVQEGVSFDGQVQLNPAFAVVPQPELVAPR